MLDADGSESYVDALQNSIEARVGHTIGKSVPCAYLKPEYGADGKFVCKILTGQFADSDHIWVLPTTSAGGPNFALSSTLYLHKCLPYMPGKLIKAELEQRYNFKPIKKGEDFKKFYTRAHIDGMGSMACFRFENFESFLHAYSTVQYHYGDNMGSTSRYVLEESFSTTGPSYEIKWQMCGTKAVAGTLFPSRDTSWYNLSTIIPYGNGRFKVLINKSQQSRIATLEGLITALDRIGEDQGTLYQSMVLAERIAKSAQS